MKRIKIKYVGFWEGFKHEETVLFCTLSRYYDVELSNDPDYVICSIFGKPYEYCRYPQVRILDCGENYLPDFNLIDYAICRYPFSLQDRNFYLPGCISGDTIGAEHCRYLEKKTREYDADTLKDKPYFANFIASHESEYSIRGNFFKELCKYKRVESPGTYLNNMEDGATVNWLDESKTNFQRKCKFTLCFESTKHEGFVTEKITDAFFADTIPVYYGSDDISKIFNEKAFINYSDFDSIDAVIEKIIELDNDDEKYLGMLMEPVFKDPLFYSRTMERYEKYVRHIFDQPLDKAYRRSRVYGANKFDDYLSKAYPTDLTQIPAEQLLDALAKKARRKTRSCLLGYSKRN